MLVVFPEIGAGVPSKGEGIYTFNKSVGAVGQAREFYLFVCFLGQVFSFFFFLSFF